MPSTVKKLTNKITCSAARQAFNISKQNSIKILDYCRKNRISVYNFLMAIYSIYIGRVSNLADFVIGTPILNRLNKANKQTNGMFVSTVPLRINIEQNSSFINFSKKIDHIKSYHFQCFQHQVVIGIRLLFHYSTNLKSMNLI